MKKTILLASATLWAMFASAQSADVAQNTPNIPIMTTTGIAQNTSNIPVATEYKTPVGTFTSISNEASSNAEMQYTIQTSKTSGGGTSTLLLNNTLGISQPNEQNSVVSNNIVSIYPNPFTTNATIVVNTEGRTLTSPVTLIVYDMLGGREVQQSEITNLKGTINKGTLPSGMYFYKVTCGNEILGNGKFIIQ